MCETCPCFGTKLQAITYERQPECVSLLVKQLTETARRINRKGKFRRIIEIRLPIIVRKVHGGRRIQNQHTSQIGFLFVLFDEQFIRFCEQFPIDMPCRFP